MRSGENVPQGGMSRRVSSIDSAVKLLMLFMRDSVTRNIGCGKISRLFLNKMNFYIALSWELAQSLGLIKTPGEKQKNHK
jgi:hypothetical protein